MALEKIDILIVDDRQVNLYAFSRILENDELNIITASSGNKALECTLDHDFALIVLDVQMPEMDGYEAASLLRGRSKTKNVPIIFVTAINTEDQHIFKGYEVGAVDYLFKPVDPDILRAKVKVFCELHRQKNIIQKQFEEIKVLRGLLPICSNCKKIRDDKGHWEMVESYIRDHSEAEFSHGICPECCEKLYPGLLNNANIKG